MSVCRLLRLRRSPALSRLPAVALYRDNEPSLGGKRFDSGDDFFDATFFAMSYFLDCERRDFAQLGVR